MRLRSLTAFVVFSGMVLLENTAAAAQDLFELEVFEAELTAPGTFALDLHTNVMTRGGAKLPPNNGSHRPAHLSVEVTRGWTGRIETAALIQSAPFASAVFAGAGLDLGSGWDLTLSAGHCVTSREPWLMKSVIGYRF